MIRKLRKVSKFMMSQTRTQTITINIFANISIRKDNQTMKFGQLIKYNVKSIFLQKSCRKHGKETSSRQVLVNPSG